MIRIVEESLGDCVTLANVLARLRGLGGCSQSEGWPEADIGRG